jgi:hypothetical protein
MVQYSGGLLKSICRTHGYVLIALLFSACDGRSGKSFLPDVPGYNSDAKQIFVLHKQLLEISGIAYINSRTLAAINDEDG